MDVFEKDLWEDIYLKALKGRHYHDIEIWNLIYFCIFVLAIIEENDFIIPRI